MRRITVAALLLLIVTSVFASGLESLRIGTGNDLFSLGVNDNYDDQLSFNGFAEASVSGHGISLYFDSYTKRYSNRIDVLSVSSSKSVQFGQFEFVPEVGIALGGDLKFQAAQNILHSYMGIPLVEITYDFTFKAFPILGVEASWDTSFGDGFHAGVSVDLDNAFGLQCMQTFCATFGITDVFGVEAGYRFHEAWSGSPTLDDFERYSNGPYTSLFVDGGFVRLDHYAVLAEGFGLGSVSVDFTALFRKATFEDEDISFTLGKKYAAMGDRIPSFKQFSFSYAVSDNLSVYVDDTYEAGCTMIVPSDNNDTVRRTARNCRKFWFLTAGAEYSFDVSRFFNPSVKAGLGFLYARAEQINYVGVDTAHIYSRENAISFVADLQAELPVLPKDWIRVAKSSLNASVFAGCYVVPSHEAVTTVLGTDGSGIHADLFTPYWGFVLDVAVDR